ncbi:MAG: transcriptional regulator [Proteobacteria bacterium]|nr:transcriptional regulator [Pseudomonadota bacterium]
MTTIRQSIIELLYTGEWTARDISKLRHISEKDVYGHLEHIKKTVREHFRMRPAECLHCGFRFTKREATRSPGKCPVCRGEHIQDPVFFCEP